MSRFNIGWARVAGRYHDPIHWHNTDGRFACRPTEHQFRKLEFISGDLVNVREACLDCLNLVDQVVGQEGIAKIFRSEEEKLEDGYFNAVSSNGYRFIYSDGKG